MNGDLRFRFEAAAIRDSQTGTLYRVRSEQGRAVEDYGLVSRLLNSKAGAAVITVGGLRHYGTQKQIVHQLPVGWEGRNLQVVLKTALVQEWPGAAEIVAVHVW
jgi:hypothetical protein